MGTQYSDPKTHFSCPLKIQAKRTAYARKRTKWETNCFIHRIVRQTTCILYCWVTGKIELEKGIGSGSPVDPQYAILETKCFIQAPRLALRPEHHQQCG